MNERPPPSMPRVLVVEDDPVSAAFLVDAITYLPAQVDLAGSMSEAMALAGKQGHALLLIDAHLPDGLGETLLRALRGHGISAAAVAQTESRDASVHDRLLAAGFSEVLHKPLGIDALKQCLQRHLPEAMATASTLARLPRWDDAAALAALGERANVDALRGLFVAELPAQRSRIRMHCEQGNASGVRDELHRLVASCGFVGATRLGQVVRDMQQAPLDDAALAALQSAIQDLLDSAWTT